MKVQFTLEKITYLLMCMYKFFIRISAVFAQSRSIPRQTKPSTASRLKTFGGQASRSLHAAPAKAAALFTRRHPARRHAGQPAQIGRGVSRWQTGNPQTPSGSVGGVFSAGSRGALAD